MQHHEYELKDYEIEYNGAWYTVSGTAYFEIENNGIGAYEYWGENRFDSGSNYAEFHSVYLDDIVFERSEEFGRNILSEQEVESLEMAIVEELNDDTDLTTELAQRIKGLQEE